MSGILKMNWPTAFVLSMFLVTTLTSITVTEYARFAYQECAE
jgi:hypothetical protein